MSWRECPFQVGKKYKVVGEYHCKNHHFILGQIVLFRGDIHDRYQEYTKYAFNDVASGELNIWFVSDFDEEPKTIYGKFFEEIV